MRGGHPALDRALARAAVRNAAQPPVSALRTVCHPLTPASAAHESPAPAGHLLDGMCVTASRDDQRQQVLHVSTVRDVASDGRRYRIRIWRELSALSPN